MMKTLFRRLTPRAIVLVVFETVLINVAVMLAVYMRLGAGAYAFYFSGSGLAKTALLTTVTQVCLYFSELYDIRLLADRRELFTRIIQALGIASFALAAVYYWFPELIIGRGVFMLTAAFVATFVVSWRLSFGYISGWIGASTRLLIVGTTPAAVALARELYDRRHEMGVEIVGFVDPDPDRVGAPVLNPGVVGTLDDIPAIVASKRVDRVVVSLADARGKLPMDRLLEMKLAGVAFDHLASVYEEYTGKIAVENLRPSWFVFSAGFNKGRVMEMSKRSLDVALASIGLLAGSPILALVALGVRVTSKGSVLYHQQRVGLRGIVFTVHKFRTMQENAEAMTGPVWAAKSGDPRVTPIGYLLRRSRLDELPQLWNVLVGEMSFVGPRPERPEFVADLTKQIPYYGQRHVVRPGITGWAQVRYTYGASVEDALQKLQYDLYYIKHLSVPLDLFIVSQTIKTVLLRKGA